MTAANLALLKKDHWLADSRNVLQLYLDAPAWKCDGGQAKAVQKQPRDEMASWSVDALADFFGGAGLERAGKDLT